MTSVKDFLDTISKPAPELPDVEDSENVDDAWVRRSHKPSLNAASNEAEVGRRRLYVATEDGESKYAGKVISSEAVFGDNQLSGLAGPTEMPSDGSEAGDAESRDEDSDEEGSEEGDSEGSGDVEMDGGTSEDDLSIQQDDGGGHGGAEEAGEDETDREVIKVEGAIAAVNLESQKKKGESIRKQLLIWDRLMHIQIKLHAALRAYNQLPRGKLAKQLLREAGEETVHNYQQMRKNTVAMVQTLLQVEDALLRRSKQTANIVGAKANTSHGESDSEDEEIASSEGEKEDGKEDMEDALEEDDDESIPDYREEATAGGDEEEEEHDKESKQRGRHSLRRIEIELVKRHKRFDGFRNSTLKKWDERTRLVGLGAAKSAKHNFSAFESVVLRQIEQIMADKHRLIRRTQTKRSDTERIGGNPETTFDVELFDDDDFYQQLLKDLIERKSAEVVDPIEMSKQWLEMQKLRQKRSKNKKIDTKASKGRKIRYVVIPKLVNYFPSTPEKVKWTHETRNQLFKSLFAP